MTQEGILTDDELNDILKDEGYCYELSADRITDHFSEIRFTQNNINFLKKRTNNSLDLSHCDFSNINLTFTDIDFGEINVKLSHAKFKNIDFTGSVFGDNSILEFDNLEHVETADFKRVNFGNNNINFEGSCFHSIFFNQMTVFGKGEKNFQGVRIKHEGIFQTKDWGEGHKDFSHMQLGTNENHAFSLSFASTNFNKGEVTFVRTKLYCMIVNFHNLRSNEASFKFEFSRVCCRQFSFKDSTLTNTSISFKGASLEECNDLSFQNITLYTQNTAEIDFSHCIFPQTGVNFHESSFTNYNIDFSNAIFEGGKTNFDDTQFINCSLDFSPIHQKNGVFAFSAKNLEGCTKIDFSGSTFECPIYLNAIESPCLLDFTATKLDHPIDFSQADIGYDVKTYGRNSSAQFRRLKKLAKDAEDHEREIDFFAKEIKSNYDHKFKDKTLICWAYQTYDLMSDFGRSVTRPFIGLSITTFIFSIIYTIFGAYRSTFLDGFNFALGHTVPFFAASLNSRKHALYNMFGHSNSEALGSLSSWLHIFTFTQSGLSAIFIFLIILALRNRFRS